MALETRSGKTAAEAAAKAAERRHGRGFHSPSVTARRRLGEVAAGHGFAEPQVLLRWAEVVGAHLAGLCEPVKVTYPRGQGLGAALVVRAPGARAPEVEHLGPRIVERVNQFYGYRAITRIKVVQTTGPAPNFGSGLAEGQSPFLGTDAPNEPTPEAAAEAAELARAVRDEGLRAALTRMGAHVLSRRAAEPTDR